MLDDPPAEIEVLHLRPGRPDLRHAHRGLHAAGLRVEVLHQQAAVHAHVLLPSLLAAGHIDLQQTQVLLRAEHLQRFVGELRRHDDLQEDRLHQLGRLARHLAVRGHDAAEDRHLVRFVGLRPRLRDVAPRGRTAGIHVLQPHTERLVELAHDAERGVGVLNVVVRQLLAVELPGEGQRIGRPAPLAVELRALVGVLAVTQRLHEVEFQEQLLVEPRLRTHVRGDHRVVLGRMGVGFGRELQTRRLLGIAAGADLREDLPVVRRIAHHRHVGPVLGRRTQHRRSADVDVLDGVLHLHAGFGDRLPEGIEVHAHQVDEADAVLLQGLQVLRIVAARQQPAVHLRVQGLHASVADFGKSRHVADIDHLDAALAQQFHRAARGDHLPAQRPQPAREIHYAGLVAHTYQCSHVSVILF